MTSLPPLEMGIGFTEPQTWRQRKEAKTEIWNQGTALERADDFPTAAYPRNSADVDGQVSDTWLVPRRSFYPAS